MHFRSELLRTLIAHRYFCLGLESLTALGLLALAVTRPTLGFRFFNSIEVRLQQISPRPLLCCSFLVLLVLAGRLALLTILPVPHPVIHDEFSYLLAADTYSSGRFTNTPHSFWPSFESVHILQQPTYMSMYPPLQGLFLALGQRLFGYAWAGVLISVVFMVLGIYWMLLGWFSPSWALVGAVLVAIRWAVFSYWMNSYWGGAVPALAGALVLGSLPRLLRASRVRYAVALAMGLSLLSNCRPYEGSILSSTAVLILLTWAYRHQRLHVLLSLTIVIPIMLIVLCSASASLIYNHRVTGKYWELPYTSDRKQYATAPLFVFQSLRAPPKYRDQSLQRVYGNEVDLYSKAQANWGFAEIARKLKDIWIFFVGPLLTIPLIAVILSYQHRRTGREIYFLVIFGAILAGLLLEVWFFPHYAAPAMSVVIALLIEGLRKMRSLCWKGKPTGIFLTRAIPLVICILTMVPLSAAVFGFRLSSWPLQWYGGTPELLRSSQVFSPLGKDGHKDLVLVRYSATHPATSGEWVYNSADIDRSSVVWARDKGDVENARLTHYFTDRRVWVFEPDREPWRLQRYDPKPETKSAAPSY